MTIIAGHWTQTGGAIAGDRAIGWDGKPTRWYRQKVRAITRGDDRILFGLSGWAVHFDFWDKLADPPETGLREWLNEALNTFLAERRARGDGEVHEGVWGVRFDALCVAREGLFELLPSGTVLQTPRPYQAVGSGAMVGMGAMWASLAALPSEIVTAGVEAANELAEGCGFGMDLIEWEWEVPTLKES